MLSLEIEIKVKTIGSKKDSNQVLENFFLLEIINLVFLIFFFF
jgi:hypothetical protein